MRRRAVANTPSHPVTKRRRAQHEIGERLDRTLRRGRMLQTVSEPAGAFSRPAVRPRPDRSATPLQWRFAMCRNIRTLSNFDPPATEIEIRDAALQFVRKLSGFSVPSKANEEAFERAVD